MSFIGMPKIDFLAKWSLISEQQLATAVTSVSYTGLSHEYSSWKLTAYILHETANGRIAITINNDSSSNYTYGELSGQSTALTSISNVGDTKFDLGIFQTGISAGDGHSFEVTVSKHEISHPGVLMHRGTSELSGSMRSGTRGGEWGNTTDPINRIDLDVDVGKMGVDSNLVLERSKTL